MQKYFCDKCGEEFRVGYLATNGYSVIDGIHGNKAKDYCRSCVTDEHGGLAKILKYWEKSMVICVKKDASKTH